MNRRRAQVGASLLAGLVVAYAGFYLLVGPVRDLEIRGVMGVLRTDRVTVVNGDTFQVLAAHGLPFRAEVTPYCSSLIALLALAVICLFVLRGPLLRRLGALGVSVLLILAGNVARIAASLWMGDHFGVHWLVLFHDWVGTLFALAYTMAGFFLMLSLLLPSATAQIQRAARVSDTL